MRRIFTMPPLLLIFLLLAVAGTGVVSVIPFVVAEGSAVPVATPPTEQPPPPPQYCLSKQPAHSYADHSVDKQKAGPGNFTDKESNHAFGPSAVPLDREGLTPERRFEEVKHEFIRRHCGDETTGGDQKLFQVGFLGSDVNHLTVAPTHPHMNPNATITRSDWEVGLEAYLATIRWEDSYLVYEKLGPNTWTLTMVPRPGEVPLVKAIKHEQPKSWYLMLAVAQPDGTVYMERRRLECGFQTTYDSPEDVPAALR